MNFVPKPLPKTGDISSGRQPSSKILRNVLLVAAFFLAIYLLLGILGELLARTIPDRWERQLGVVSTALTSKTNVSLERAQAVFDRLTASENLRELDYALFIFDHDQPNAVAIVGGGIGVTASLLENVESETGLAFVLAHELGHHQQRHILRAMGRRLLLSLVATSLFNTSGLSDVNTAFAAAETGFSRKQERQADVFALQLVHKTYGHTDGALDFFEDIQQRGREHLWQKYVGSHPLTKERLEELRELARELGKGE